MSLPEALSEKSSLTEKQFQALLRYMKVVSGEMKYKQAAASMSPPVTIGSYYRTLQQGKACVRESLVTVLVAMGIGLTKTEDVRRLFDLVGRVGTKVAEEDKTHFNEILQTLLDRLVM